VRVRVGTFERRSVQRDSLDTTGAEDSVRIIERFEASYARRLSAFRCYCGAPTTVSVGEAFEQIHSVDQGEVDQDGIVRKQ
jgi:hypothetical protein